MPTPPAAKAGAPRGIPKVVIYLDSDDGDEGGGPAGRSRGEGAVVGGGGGAGRKLIKPEPVDDVGCSLDYAGARRSEVVATPPRPQNPRSPSSRLPIAVVDPSGRPQPLPEIIDISSNEDDDEEEEDREFGGGLPLETLMIKEEPFDDWGSNREHSAAAGRAMVAVAAPGSSTASRKRKRGSPGKAKADARGGRHAVARSSRENKAGKSREAGRGDAGERSHSAKEALVSSEESRGALCKARRGGGSRSSGKRRNSAAPANLFGATVGSRIRSRSRQQGRVQYAARPARVVSDDTDEDGEEAEQESERREEVEVMEVDDEESGDGDNGEAQENEQDEDLQGKNREDNDDDADDGDNHDDDDKEEEGEKELEEEEGGNQEDSFSIYEGDEEEEEAENDEEDDEESDEDGEELAETGEDEPCSPRPSSAMACSSAMSGGDGTRIFRKRLFEGICLPAKPVKTIGRGIGERTRSKRKCFDKKLLKRGTFSKPFNIDLSDSSSESEEDIPPPVLPRGVPSSSEEDMSKHAHRKRRKSRNGRRHKESNGSSDDFEKEMPSARNVGEGSSRRLKKGASNWQAAREGCTNQDGSNPGHAKYNGPNVGNPMNISNAQDDMSFKRNASIAQMKKRSKRAAKAAYDELFNSLFAEWENHVDVPAHAQSGDSLPLVFSFGDEEEKSENDVLQEDLWNEFNIALESINLDSQGCDEGEMGSGQKVPPQEATSCKDGKHDFIIDEQVGVRCKHCNVVDLEIRYVLPSMGKIPAGRESQINPELDSLFKDMLTLLEENELLASNEDEGTCGFGAHKAGTVWDLIPGVKEDMFPHQLEAFNFMWKKLAGSTDIQQLKRTMSIDTGGGCVISHAPGTGKTRLAIAFVQSYLKLFPRCSPVIIAPRGMLSTWEQEFRKWKVKLPFHVLNSIEINWSEDKTIQEKASKDGSFRRKLIADKMEQKYRRLLKLASWMNGTSIIGVSYSLFRKLAKEEVDGDEVRKLLLEKPDLLVLDEGHTPRNKKSLIWKVLAEVRTEKRIILSGTPFQNSFEELYNTLYLVRPKDAILLEKNEGKDFWTSLRLNDITEASIRKVQKILEDVVHIHSGKFLEKSLPGLRESVVILNPLPYQKQIITSMEKTMSMGLDAEYKISLASVHPSLITNAKLSNKEESLVNIPKLESIRLDPSEGVKTRFVLEIVRLCEVLNERVLVFSQYIQPLLLIIEHLKMKFNWTEGKEILLMTGNVTAKTRETLMEAFNNMKSGAKVMLASTKACCEGITLVGASRVVLLDVVWNPSVGRQAIGRAYRIGQEKIVYTYNLIAEGTAEKGKYDRQAKKEHMSKLLFSKEPQLEGCSLSPELIFNDRILETMTARADLKKMFVKIYVDNQTHESNWREGEQDMPVSPIV
ncbi:hypothetical protein ACP70R_027516 [Stipagrostis hirtigluma subsp. patula]